MHEPTTIEPREHDACTTSAPRRFDAMEVGAMISSLALASIACCPDDDARLVATVGPEVITLACPTCGAHAEWRIAGE